MKILSHKMKLFCGVVVVLAIISPACSDNKLEEYKAQGHESFEARDYKKARKFYGLALHEKPSDREALYYIGVSFKNDFYYDSAMFYLKRADILNVNDRDVAEQMFEVALALKDWEIATTAMNVLINTGDSQEQYYAQRADLWLKRDHPANAYYYTRLAIEHEPDNQELYINAAVLAEVVDSLPASMEYIDQAIKLFGPLPPFLANKALYLNKMGEHRKAEKMYRSLLKLDSTRTDIKFNLAKSLEFQSSRAAKMEALKIYRELLPRYGYELPIDSLIAYLEQELN